MRFQAGLMALIMAVGMAGALTEPAEAKKHFRGRGHDNGLHRGWYKGKHRGWQNQWNDNNWRWQTRNNYWNWQNQRNRDFNWNRYYGSRWDNNRFWY